MTPPTATLTRTGPAAAAGSGLKREVGFWGLMFISLGCVIGSGWLMSALNVSRIAGPASLITWVLGALMLSVIALVYAELGTTYPVAGGCGRYAAYSHGPVAGFFSGWASFIATIFIAPIEVLAAIAYTNSVGWIHDRFPMLEDGGPTAGLLNARGTVVAIALMVVFTAMNLAGAKFMSDSNSLMVIWKTAIPLLAIGVIAFSSFHVSNFTQGGGGFMPHGWNGVFAALPGGVVFALEGFEQAAQLAGEAKNPEKHMSKAILAAMAVGALLYTALEVVFIAGIDPQNIVNGWDAPLAAGDYGAYYTLALGIGATWLAGLLIIDAVISPTGTGIVYVGTSARMTYALAAERELPQILRRTNAKKVPYVAILVSAILGCLSFVVFKSWSSLVIIVTGATSFMYSLAPIALASLLANDVHRRRTYRAPIPAALLPTAFIFTNLIVYWGGFEATWQLALLLLGGLGIFVILVRRSGHLDPLYLRAVVWLVPWVAAQVIIGWLGNYGTAPLHLIPNGIDALVVAGISLVIFYWSKAVSLSTAQTENAVRVDAEELLPLQDMVAADLPLPANR